MPAPPVATIRSAWRISSCDFGQRRRGQRLHQVRWRADLLARGPHEPDHGLGGALGPRVRRADDGVAALDREQRLDRRRGVRAGGRDQRGDHADRLGDLHQPAAGCSSTTPTVRIPVMSASTPVTRLLILATLSA